MDEDPDAKVAPYLRRLRFSARADRLRESLLFLPVLILAGGVLLQEITNSLDDHFDFSWLRVFRMSPDVASTLLSTIAGATITTAGVVFSLLVVSLQLASGQFSPRVLRTFWRDRVGQAVIGVLLASFAFCVLALGQLNTQTAHAPTLTVATALVLSLGAILGIVTYLSRITHQQYVGRILETIQVEATDLIEATAARARAITWVRRVDPPDPAALGEALVVPAHVDGWIQQMSREAMLAATPPGGVISVETRVGAYAIRGEPLVRIWPRPPESECAAIIRVIHRSAVIGPNRTMQQDIDFAFRQLNDIGLRALSPAVNDPTTAIEVVLRVTSILRPLLVVDIPAPAYADEDGRVLMMPWQLDHADYVRHAYAQIRRYAAEHPQVALAMVRCMTMLRDFAAGLGRPREAAVAELESEVRRLIDDAGRSSMSREDLDRIAAIAVDRMSQ